MVSFFSVVMLCSITILPAGDSITAGFHEKPTGSYRYWLEQKFMTNNIDYDFIGELSRGGSYMVDANHHGIPGAKIEELAEYSKRQENIEINLTNQEIIFGNKKIEFEVDGFKKKCLVNGLDDIAMTLEQTKKISSYENEAQKSKPWMN